MATTIQQSATTLSENPRRFNLSIGTSVAWLFLFAISVLFIIPFFWMLSTSLKDVTELGGSHWIPKRLAWENYQAAFGFGMWGRWLFNTLFITITGVIGTVLSTSIVAYSFARLRWPGRDKLFSVVLA